MSASPEIPSTPRMPPFRADIFWAANAFLAVYMAFYVWFEPPLELVIWIEVAALASLYAVVAWRLALHTWQVRRAVHFLRRFDVNGREAIMKSLDDEAAAAYLESRVWEHGSPQTEGLVERFTFSPVDVRELTVLTWATAVCAGCVGLPGVIADLSVPARTGILAGSLALALVATTLQRTVRRMARVFEVSPFGLSEIAPDGSIARVLWSFQLALRNRPWLRRFELTYAGAVEHIAIPYSVVGFERLAELVLLKGGFVDNLDEDASGEHV